MPFVGAMNAKVTCPVDGLELLEQDLRGLHWVPEQARGAHQRDAIKGWQNLLVVIVTWMVVRREVGARGKRSLLPGSRVFLGYWVPYRCQFLGVRKEGRADV